MKIKVHSIVGLTVKNLKYFVQTALAKPKNIPRNNDQKHKRKKLYKIKNGVVDENSLPGPANSYTVLKRMIQTASLVIPSPKTKLNNLGY